MNAGIILLCAGQQIRLATLGYPKHLIPVAGEPILLRTVRLVREMADVPICVVTNAGPLSDVCRDHGLIEYVSAAGLLLQSAALAMQAQRWDRATILLGDVCWSRRLLRHWLQAGREQSKLYCARIGPSAVTGKPYSEHFAVQCALTDLQQLGVRWGRTLRDAMRMRNFRRVSVVKQPADDFTEDFDTPEDVERLMPLLSELVTREAA